MLNRFRKKQSNPYKGMAHTQIDRFDWLMYSASMERGIPPAYVFICFDQTLPQKQKNGFVVIKDVMKTIKLHQQRAFVSKTDRFFFLNVVSHDYRFKICLTVAFGAPIAKVRGYSRGNVPRTGDVYRTHNRKLIQGFFPQMGLFSNESKREQLRNYSFARSIKLKKKTEILEQFFERRSSDNLYSVFSQNLGAFFLGDEYFTNESLDWFRCIIIRRSKPSL